MSRRKIAIEFAEAYEWGKSEGLRAPVGSIPACAMSDGTLDPLRQWIRAAQYDGFRKGQEERRLEVERFIKAEQPPPAPSPPRGRPDTSATGFTGGKS